MKRISLDTNAISYLFRGDDTILQVMNKADVIFLPYFTIAELKVGFKGGKRFEQNSALLYALESKNKVRRIYPSNTTIDIYIEIFQELKSKGKPIPVHDIWIASLAMEKESVLVTFDQHFGNISKLDVWPIANIE